MTMGKKCVFLEETQVPIFRIGSKIVFLENLMFFFFFVEIMFEDSVGPFVLRVVYF